MAVNSPFANASGSESETPAAAPATTPLRSVIEWSDLVGFRRRGSAKPAPVAAEPASEAIVVVGKGATIVGEITNCSQVEIAGALEGKIVADTVIVREGGVLKGHVRAERAEVHGIIEGQIQVEDHLDIHSTGEVSGELSYGKLSVASGGRLAGSIEIVPGAAPASAEEQLRSEQGRTNGVHGANVQHFAASNYA
jgi:cytoskeletal protein CcmA (bactofilin family)